MDVFVYVEVLAHELFIRDMTVRELTVRELTVRELTIRELTVRELSSVNCRPWIVLLPYLKILLIEVLCLPYLTLLFNLLTMKKFLFILNTNLLMQTISEFNGRCYGYFIEWTVK